MRVSMTFSNSSLQMVRRGISLACDELHNQIATCPDVNEYAEDIVEYERELDCFKKLLVRIDKKLEGAT
jgi:hypothetical protein